VGYDDSAVSQAYIGEKTFVSVNKNAADKPIRKRMNKVIADVSIDS
jgi:hypothetical protein